MSNLLAIVLPGVLGGLVTFWMMRYRGFCGMCALLVAVMGYASLMIALYLLAEAAT